MGAWALLLLPLLTATAQTEVCSVNQTVVEVKENTKVSGPLVDIYVPKGSQVTLAPTSTPLAFRIQDAQLFLNVTPDYEVSSMLQADLECRRGDTMVALLRVFVIVLDVNDNAPLFPFGVKASRVPEDTKVGTTVIPEAELEAQDQDKDDILFYTLQEVTPGASDFFSLVGVNRPALRLDQALDWDKLRNMTFQLLARDTQEEGVVPSHTATATVVLEVQPADLRPPWFLPCGYSDSHVCIQAQYRGAVPTGHRLPAPLILRPGPIYAVDGDHSINQRIVYSLLRGHEDGTFVIDADSGNLTMTRSIPRPRTFLLVVKGEQEDGARYSVTQVTVEARDASGSQLYFPQSLYNGTVALGSGAGVAVKDAVDPSQPLRIRAQDPEFPDLNSAITYRITNNSNFRMVGEGVLTAAPLEQAGTFYAEVEASNTVMPATATTVLQIEVSEREPIPTDLPGSPTPPEAGRTTQPTSSVTSEAPRPSTTSSGGSAGSHSPTTSSTSEAPRPPKPSQGTSTSSPGGSAGPHPPPSSSTSEAPRPPKPSQGTSTNSPGGSVGPHSPTSTALRPLTSPTPGGPSSEGTSTLPTTAPSSGGSTQTLKPGSPGTGGSGHAEDPRFSATEMAALGGVLGALLLLALLALAVLVHKHYGPQLRCCSGKAPEPQPWGFDNKAFLPDHVPESPEVARDEGGPAGVRSILTKERRPEGGYKAVWFGENIGAEADVVVLNAPTSDTEPASDSGSESSGDEGAEVGPGPGAHADSTDF